jgi:hypothetical protein
MTAAVPLPKISFNPPFSAAAFDLINAYTAFLYIDSHVYAI